MIGKEKERGDLFMNKNLKRALNTTAAVSMSLAMVLGAVAPSTATSVNAASYTASVENALTAKSYVENLLNALGDVSSLPIDQKIYGLGAYVDGVNETSGQESTLPTLKKILDGNAKVKADAFDQAVNTFDVKEVLDEAYKFASVVGYSEEQVDTLAYLLDAEYNSSTKNAVEMAEELVKQDTVNLVRKGWDTEDDEAVIEKYEKLSALLEYKGNIQDGKLSSKVNLTADDSAAEDKKTDSAQDVLDFIEDKFADLEADYKDVKEDNLSEDAKTFADAFLGTTVTAGKTVEDLVEDEEYLSYKNLNGVESFIKKATKDTYVAGGIKYGDVKEEDTVAELVEGLEAVAEGMKETKELIKETEDEKEAFDKLETKLKELAAVVTADPSDAEWKNIQPKIDAFRAKDIEALKAYVDTVVNEFWTVAVEERSSGTYRVKEVNAGLGQFYSLTDAAGTDLTKIMKTLVERDGEETFYDLLVADAASVDELLKAVTTDIEGITFNTVMTNTQANKIIAAHKALTKLDADSKKIYNDLTRAEKAEVDANRELIDVLYKKLLYTGNVITVGWVEDAKGWQYYDNNGNRVMEGWAPGNGYWSYMKNGYAVMNDWCAAKEGWYYMGADGKMVTGKVTINGVEEDFGTDGIWVRK